MTGLPLEAEKERVLNDRRRGEIPAGGHLSNNPLMNAGGQA